MQIIQIDTADKRAVNRFINVQFDLYKGCEQWVPPIVDDVRMQLNRDKNPFYRKNDAVFLVAVKDGRDVGRIAVLDPKHYNEFKGEKNAHFYLFDCIDDQSAADALLNAGAKWAKARGLEVFRGPLGFMAFDGFGMLAVGFEYHPAVGIPYNYDYYPRLVENWGFELEERVYSGYLEIDRMRREFPEKIIRLADKIKTRNGFTTKTFKSKRELRQFAAPRLAELYNRTLTHIAGDPPLSQDEVDTVADAMLQITDPDMLKFVMKGDDIVGFLFCFLDISNGLRKSKGRLLPFGIIHLLRDMKKTDWVNLNGMGIAPEYQGLGGPALMYAELYQVLAGQDRFKHADVVQISEFNHKSLNEMRKFGVDFYKTHHIYRRDITGLAEG